MEKEREQRKKEISLKTDKMTAEADAERQRIIDEKELVTKKKTAEAECYRLEQLALGNSALHTPEHIRLEDYRSAHHNALMRKIESDYCISRIIKTTTQHESQTIRREISLSA